jgi:hypothetical protein
MPQQAIILYGNIVWYKIFHVLDVELNGETTAVAKKGSITSLQLTQLLIDIKEHGPNVCIRYRLEGELWQKFFVKIMHVNDYRVFVLDEVNDRLMSVPILPIIQIELDNAFKQYQPYDHYDVLLDR